MKILQIANYNDVGGGISVQVRLIRKYLVADGHNCKILSTKGSLLKRFVAIAKLCFIGNKYDVFHIHACSDRGFFPAMVGIDIGRLLKKRVVLTFHGGGAESFFQRQSKMVRYYLSRTDENIVLSHFVGDIFSQYDLPYTIIPNIIDFEEGFFRDRAVFRPRFISVRSFNDIYNVECTLRAFHTVQKNYPDAELVLLGDGPLRKSLEEYVKEHAIRNVKFGGRVHNDDVYHYLDQSDIMLSSALFDNMPVSVLEGFNAGLLVISSNVGGVPYIIRDGENGLLFESDDDKAMAQKMIFALENPDTVHKMVNKARSALIQYSWKYSGPKLMSLYNNESTV